MADSTIRNCIIPDFMTTTDKDMAVASMTVMATMKQYFDLGCRTGRMISSVTLLVEHKDWENI